MTKVKTNQLGEAELQAVFPAVVKELNRGQVPYLCFLLTHGQWPMVWPYSQAGGQWKPGLLKGCPYGIHSPVESLWEFEECIEVGHADAHQRNSFPGLKGE